MIHFVDSATPKESGCKHKQKYKLIRNVGQQRDISGFLDCLTDFALMLRAVSGESPGEHLASFRDKLPEAIGIFVIDKGHLPLTEFAILFDIDLASFGSLVFFEAISHACHYDLLVEHSAFGATF